MSFFRLHNATCNDTTDTLRRVDNVMQWADPSLEELKSLLQRATSMTDEDIERVLRLHRRGRRIRLSETDRRFAARALSRSRRPR